MSEIHIASLASVFVVMLLGLVLHWVIMKKDKRVKGNLISYLLAQHPGRSMSTVFALAAASWYAATTGTADEIHPAIVWGLLSNGVIHIPMWNALGAHFMAGYFFDSLINKGDKTS